MFRRAKKSISMFLTLCMLCSALFPNHFAFAQEQEVSLANRNIDGLGVISHAKAELLEAEKNEALSKESSVNQPQLLGTDNIQLEAKIDDDEGLLIYSSSPGAKEFFSKVISIYVNGKENRYALDEHPDRRFTVEAEGLKIETNPAVFKKNEIELVTSEGDSKKFEFINANGHDLSEGLKIKGFTRGEAGENLTMPDGSIISFKAQELKIDLDYDYDAKALYSLTKKIKSILVDDYSYPLVDPSDNKTSFILYNNAITFFDKNPVGKAVIDDYDKREKHRAEIVFEDGSLTYFEDQGYVKPDRDTNPVPPTPPQPQPPTDGIANKYKLDSVQVADSYGVKEVRVATTPEITREHVKKFKTVKVNGMVFSGEKASFSISVINGLNSNVKEVVEAAEKASPIALEITFDDNSVLSNNVTPQPPKKDIKNAKAYLMSEDKSKMSIVDTGLNREIELSPSSVPGAPMKIYKGIIRFNPIRIENKEVDIKELYYQGMGMMQANPVPNTKNAFEFSILERQAYGEGSDKDTEIAVEYVLDTTSAAHTGKKKAILVLDWNNNFTPPSNPKPDQPWQPPSNPGDFANRFKVESIERENGKLRVKLNSALLDSQLPLLKRAQVNGQDFDLKENELKLRDGGKTIVIQNQAVASKAKEKEAILLYLVFRDGSKLKYEIKDQTTPNPPGSGDFSLYSIKEVKNNQGWSKNELHIILTPKIEPVKAKELLKQVQKITVNGTDFNDVSTKFFANYDGHINSSDKAVKAAADSATPVIVTITFKDGKSISNGSTSPTPPPQPPQPQPPTGIAANYKIKELKVDKDQKALVVYFDQDQDLSPFLDVQIKKVQVEGQDFEVTKQDIHVFGKLIRFKKAELFEKASKAEDANKIKLRITFSDKSELKYNIVDAPSKPDLTLDSVLENGEYTLTLKAFQLNTGQSSLSTLGGFFDVRAKLVVKDNKKVVTLLNHTSADLMLDFAIQKGNTFEPFEKKVIKNNKKGEPSLVEYSTELDKLTGSKIVAVLGSGPMGGNPGEIGQYDNPNYKKAEIVFDNAVVKGWTDFKHIEDIKKNEQESHARLIEALIAHGVDTNKDGVITPEELMNAEGVNKEVAGVKRSNVIDLEGTQFDDMSILKDLGPKIKVLNINGSRVKELPADVFKKSTGLTHLYLGANEFKSLPSGVFDNLTNLEEIDFDGNRLGDLPANIFDKNVKLRSLSLMNSGVTSVPDGMLRNLKSLEYLYLQENQLKTLPNDLFENSQKLKGVYLNHNQLTNLPSSLGSVKRLKEIFAQSNHITMIPEELGKLARLNTLDVEFNDIESVPTKLLVNMATLSQFEQVRVDLSSNNLTELPIKTLVDTLPSGKKFTKFEINKNNLKPVLSAEEELDLKKLGVEIDDGKETYYPQKGSIEAKLVANNGDLKLNQEFDVLELYYWDLGDSAYYSGKEFFKTKEEFKDYLLNAGRDYHKIDRSLERDVAIQAILNKKSSNWKVETVITKNGGTVVYRSVSDVNSTEGIQQTFVDAGMKAGDQYTMTKTLFIKGVFGWRHDISYSVTATAGSGSTQPNPGYKMVSVVAKQKNDKSKDSMVNRGLNPQAKVENKNNKFQYTVEFKPIQVESIEAEIAELQVEINGKFEVIEPKAISNGAYNKAYTFEFDQEVEEVLVSFKAPPMPGTQQAYLMFKGEVKPQLEQVVKSYLLNKGKTELSKANSIFTKDVPLKANLNQKGEIESYQAKLKFGEMTLGTTTARVSAVYLMINNEKVVAKELTNEKGAFIVNLPVNMVKDSNSKDDTEIVIGFETEPSVHAGAFEAILLMDWNGDYTPPKANTPAGRVIPAQIMTADGKQVSMAGKALESISVKPSSKKAGPFKLVEMTFKFNELEIQGEKAGVETLSVQLQGQWMEAKAVAGQKGVFTLDMFERVIQDANSTEDTKLKIKVTTYPKVQGHDQAREALLVLDWNGDFKPENNGGVNPPPVQPNPPGGGGQTIERYSIPVWLKKPDGSPSMANGALVQTAQVEGYEGNYTYRITFNPMSIEFGGKLTEGNITEFYIYPDGNEQVIAPRKVGSSVEYEFTLPKKVNDLRVAITVDIMRDLGMEKATSYLVFNWDGSSTPGGGSGGGGGAGGGSDKKDETTIKDDKTPLASTALTKEQLEAKADRILKDKDNKKYYKEETLKAIQNALEALKKGEKDAEKTLASLLESARIERISTILSQGYMSGYPGNKFMPNKNITRAEAAAMFDRLIDEEVKMMDDYKDIKNGVWYSESMKKMVSLGYIKANSKGNYVPEQLLTRAEYAYILAKLKNLPAGTKAVKDVPKEHWAAAEIAACVEAGIIAGYKDGTFKPEKPITRAEAVAMMSRAFAVKTNLENKKQYTDVPATHWAYEVIMTASKMN